MQKYTFPCYLGHTRSCRPRRRRGQASQRIQSSLELLSYLALHALQHCGQEGARIVAANQNGLKTITLVGLVSYVFTESKLSSLPGNITIWHIQYLNFGVLMLNNLHSFISGCKLGTPSVAHNGMIVKFQTIEDKSQGERFHIHHKFLYWALSSFDRQI